MYKFLVVIIFNLLLSIGLVGQQNEKYKPPIFTDIQRTEKIKKTFSVVDSIYKKHAFQNNFPGISFGLVVDGKLMYKNSYGYTNVDKKIQATSTSLFRIASMSKSFTSMAILKLRDQGKLNLDDPAYLYISELKNISYLTTDAPSITIRHLLTHSAGFPEDNPWGDRQLSDSDTEFIEFLSNPISFSNTPGIAYEYSNLGFALLGKIITKVSGISYQEYIKQNILLPLNMNETTYDFTEISEKQVAHGYRWQNNKWIEEKLLGDAPDGSWGAMGSMISSIDEFANYMSVHLMAWPPSNNSEDGILKRSSVREMHHPWNWNGMNTNYKYPDGSPCAITTAYAYGLGWMKDCNQKTYISHSGGLPGFGSQWRIMPEYGIGVVAFANKTYASFNAVNLKVLDTIVKLANLKPRELPISDILNHRKNDLIKLLPEWKNTENDEVFAENFFADNPIDSLIKQSKELYNKLGKIKTVKEIKPENQLRGTFIVEGEKQSAIIFFTLTPEANPKIQEFNIRLISK